MKDKRKIEILEMMLEKLNDKEYAKSFRDDKSGLCIITGELYGEESISDDEEYEIDIIILGYTKYRQIGWNSNYIYKPGSIPPRIKLLNRIIKKLKNN